MLRAESEDEEEAGRLCANLWMRICNRSDGVFDAMEF